jgi:hypothetical protein
MSWLDLDDDDDELEFDETDIRVRPNPKANRPRTKRRPAHADAVIGRVLGVDRGRYTVLIDEDGPTSTPLSPRARELRKQPIVTGDRARVVGDTSGDEGTLRASSASRSAPRCCGAAPTTPTRWSGSSSPTPTRCSSSSPPPTPSRGLVSSTATSSRRWTPASIRSSS